MLCSWVHVVISFIKSCVKQSGEPRPILACERLSLFQDASVIPIMILSSVTS